MTDDLLRRARGGDENAWRELVASQRAILSGYVQRHMGMHLRRSVSLSDLLQEVFLRVFSAMRAMPADATLETFRAWLFRHANWVLANHGLAAQELHGESEVAPVEREPLAAARDSSTGGVTRADQLAWMAALLERLAPPYRDVVRLRLQGLSFAAIAERLGCEEANARQRFARVVRGLRERTGGERPPPG